jgi:hypothetical protein
VIVILMSLNHGKDLINLAFVYLNPRENTNFSFTDSCDHQKSYQSSANLDAIERNNFDFHTFRDSFFKLF